MKVLKVFLCLLLSIGLSACSRSEAVNSTSTNSSTLSGVYLTKNGDVTVYFEIPHGMDIEDVLGQHTSKEHKISINGEKIIEWRTVQSGGTVCISGDRALYAPTATVSNVSGSTPPSWALLTGIEDLEPLDPADAEKLAEEYGIQLYFNGEDSSQLITDSPIDQKESESVSSAYEVKDYYINDVSNSFSDGYTVVEASNLDNSESGTYILSTDGKMAKAPAYHISNFYNDTAATQLDVSAQFSGYADSIINAKGEIVWSMVDEESSIGKKYFSNVDSWSWHPFFRCKRNEMDLYQGYLPIEFTVDSFDYSGNLVGIIDSSGKWAVEPTKVTSGWNSITDSYIAVANFAIDYSTGDVITFEESGNEREIKLEEIENKAYFKKHDGLKFDYFAEPQGFYDEQGNCVIDLSNYNLELESEFNDGFAVVNIQNENGSDYLIVIDTKGNVSAGPLKNEGHGQMSEGFFWSENGESGYFMDVYGNQLGNQTGSRGFDFSDSRGWIYDQEWICIDETGKRVF